MGCRLIWSPYRPEESFFFFFEYGWKSLGSHKLPYWGIMHLFRHEVYSKQFVILLFGTAFGTNLLVFCLFSYLFPYLLSFSSYFILWFWPFVVVGTCIQALLSWLFFCGEPCSTWHDILSLWGPLWLQRERWAAWHEGQGRYLDLTPLVRHNRMPLSQLQLIAARIYFAFLFAFSLGVMVIRCGGSMAVGIFFFFLSSFDV